MSDLEKVELSRYQREIVADLQHMVDKYCRIMGWDIPELDEAEARKLLFSALKAALAEVESNQ
jgi:hypothetical protein